MAKREEQKENPSKYNISRTTIIFIVFSVTGRIDYLASFMYIYISKWTSNFTPGEN